MTPRDLVKVALLLAGFVLFGASIRFDEPMLWRAAVVCLAVALLLRRRKPRSDKP